MNEITGVTSPIIMAEGVFSQAVRVVWRENEEARLRTFNM